MTDEAQTGQPAQGWYPDPNDPSRLRWWDGSTWTDHTHGGDEASGAQATATQPATQAETPGSQQATTPGSGGIVSNPAPSGGGGSRPTPASSSSSGEKGAVAQWLSVRSNQLLLVILIIALALFIFVMVGGAA